VQQHGDENTIRNAKLPKEINEGRENFFTEFNTLLDKFTKNNLTLVE
jgi:hypothetical protein